MKNESKLEGLLADKNNSESGETFIGSQFLMLSILYSAVAPGIDGFKVASGQIPLDTRLILPLAVGPVLGLFGGTSIGNPGGLYVASASSVISGISFGLGYLGGYLLK